MQYLPPYNIPTIVGLLSLFLLSGCFNEPKGYEFTMENPDPIKPDTDSIEVYIIYKTNGEKQEALLYAGKKGDDGFEGPYDGVVEEYDGGDFELRIVQFNDEGEIISHINTTYSEEAERGEKHITIDYDLNIEKIKSVTILKDSTAAFGTFSTYVYKDQTNFKADSIIVYNGSLTELDKREPSAVLTYSFGQYGVEHVKMNITTADDIDSSFSYDNEGRLEKIEIEAADEKETLKFKYDGSGHLPTSTSHLNTDNELDRIVKHVYTDKGYIEHDSVFSVDSSGQSVKRLVSYIYKDDSVKTAEQIYLKRQSLKLAESVKFIYDETSGHLIKKEKWDEGGVPLLVETFSYTNSRLGNPLTVIQENEESKELMNYYVYQYHTIKYEHPLSKPTAGHTYGPHRITDRIPNWCLEDFECR